MDERRLDTEAFMAMGGLTRRPPRTEIPADRERADAVDDHFNRLSWEKVGELVEAGKVVSASNYYGIRYAWKAAPGVYRGTLLQYRAVTENPTFATLDELLNWFEDMYASTDG